MSRSRPMVGSATLTTVSSMRIIESAPVIVTRISHLRLESVILMASATLHRGGHTSPRRPPQGRARSRRNEESMGRIRAGWALTKKSWGLLKENRVLIRFPLYGAVATILMGIIVVGPGLY